MEQLGIEPKLLFAQIVNFAIIIIVLTKLLYKPILGMLEKRRKEIEAGLLLSEKMKAEEAKLKEKQEKMLAETRKEVKIMIEEGKKQGKEAEKEIIAQAQIQAKDILEKGKLEVDRRRKDMEKGLRKESVDMAVAMAKRLISSVLSQKDQHRLLTEQLKELEKG